MSLYSNIPPEVVLDHIVPHLPYPEQIRLLREMSPYITESALLRSMDRAVRGFREIINKKYRQLIEMTGKRNIDDLDRSELQNLALRAVRNGFPDLVEYIVLVRGFNPERRLSSLMSGSTTLFLEAIRSSQPEIVKSLLDLGVIPNPDQNELARLIQDPNVDTEIREMLRPYFQRRNISPYPLEETIPQIRRKRTSQRL